MSKQKKAIYEFGPFQLDRQEHLLQREGAVISLTPKAFDLLLALVERHGRLVEKEELFQVVWPDTIVEESNLSSNIALIRKALGEGEKGLRFIETVPKRGYRFVADVREVRPAADDELIPEPAESTGAETPLATGSTSPKRASRWARPAVLLGFGAVGLLISAAVWLTAFRHSAQLPQPRIVPFTTFPGSESQPTFSPDGNQIAFVWNGEKGDHSHIYVKQIGNEAVSQLTNSPDDDSFPSWSPDGRYIAFIRKTAKGFGHFLIPSLGGTERRITETFFYALQGNSWSPDGQWLGFSGRDSEQQPFGLYLVKRETGEMHKLTSPPAGILGDTNLAIAPDGKTVVFPRWIGVNDGDLYLVSVAGGEPKRLTSDHYGTGQLTWTADGREVLFVASRAGVCARCMWRMPATGGTAERVEIAGQHLGSFAISRQGTLLALTNFIDNTNIWQIELAAKQKQSPQKLIYSTQTQDSPQYSPDGKKIAFGSSRSGGDEIWVCDSAGQHPIQLTSSSTRSGSPRWSPDGRQIVFDSVAGGSADIYVINAEGGQPRRLTTEASEDVVPSWSQDGQWIYFSSNRSGTLQIWKMPAAGGQAVQFTRQGGFDSVESPDGQYLYYAKGRRTTGIWRIPVAGGEETFVLDHHRAGFWRYWAVVDQGIYFATAEQLDHPLIEFFSLTTGQFTLVTSLEKRIQGGVPGLAISPDGRWLIWAQQDQVGSDIMLMENLR
jgi:Tol biopolymer transport system component/DNA-binding winged helix-turn-helix (wHTH) protein